MRRRTAGKGLISACQLMTEDNSVEARVEPADIFADYEQCDQNDGKCTKTGHNSPALQGPERHAGEDESDPRERNHLRLSGQDALKHRNINGPTQQHQTRNHNPQTACDFWNEHKRRASKRRTWISWRFCAFCAFLWLSHFIRTTVSRQTGPHDRV